MPPDSPAAEYSPIQKSPNRAIWTWAVRLSLGLLLLGLLIWHGDTQPPQAALRATSPWILALAVLSYWATQILSAWKWQLLLRARDTEVSLAACCRWYLAGMFWNLWMPTNIGGDGVRAYLAARHGMRMSTAVSSIFIERLTGFIALLVLGIGGVLLDAHIVNAGTIWTPLIVTTALLVAAGVLFLALRTLVRQENPPLLLRKWLALQDSLEFYAHAPQRPALGIALLLSLVFQAAQIGINIGLAAAVGLELPLITFFWLIPLLAIASLLPVGIGGLGVREAAAVSLLATFPLAGGTIIAWSLLWQVTIWLASLPGVLVLRRM